MKTITKETHIKSLLKNMPEAEEILMAYGLYCVNCHFSDVDTLADGATMHGLSEQDVKDIITDLNNVIEKS